MKFLVISCLMALALAAPQERHPHYTAETIVDQRDDRGDGNFNYLYQTSNGLNEERTGVPGVEGQSNMQGSFTMTFEDGSTAVVSFIADENGYQPSSDLLPVGPELPDHVHELLRIAEEQRAAGITFERK